MPYFQNLPEKELIQWVAIELDVAKVSKCCAPNFCTTSKRVRVAP